MTMTYEGCKSFLCLSFYHCCLHDHDYDIVVVVACVQDCVGSGKKKNERESFILGIVPSEINISLENQNGRNSCRLEK